MSLTNESSGVPATMLLAPASLGTTAAPYAYPVYTGGGQQGGGNGFGNDWGWIVLLILLIAIGGWGNNGNNGGGNGGFFGGTPVVVNDNGNGYAVQRGFDQAAVMSGINGVQNGVQNLSTQLCNCCSDISTQLCNGFAGNVAAVTNAQNALAQQMYANTIADLERSFAAQTANTQGLTALQSQFAQCCCDNRLATANLTSTILSENCADRAAISDGIRDVIENCNRNNQRILDQLCADKIDAKNERIADLERQLTMANLSASQIAQTAQIQRGQVEEVDALYQRLRDCPVPTQPVYGSQPIFTCPGNYYNNNGCGCGCSGNNF